MLFNAILPSAGTGQKDKSSSEEEDERPSALSCFDPSTQYYAMDLNHEEAVSH
jgi:hypothetical protein